VSGEDAFATKYEPSTTSARARSSRATSEYDTEHVTRRTKDEGMMMPEQFQKLLRRRERTALEFKEARRDLPRSFFETVCAFLNREGAIERRSL
jgi:hypothetical protein